MSISAVMTMGDRGRVVIPQAIRDAQNLQAGDRLIVFEDEHGMTLMTRAQLAAKVHTDYQKHPTSLADELIAERRTEATREQEH